MNEAREKTEVVQAVVPVAVANEIRKDKRDQGARSVSNVVARILWGHYRKRVEAAQRRAA